MGDREPALCFDAYVLSGGETVAKEELFRDA